MAATSPPARPPLAAGAGAGFALASSPVPGRVPLALCRCRRRRAAPPRWRPPRCSRGGSKPAVKGVADDEEETPRGPKPEKNGDDEAAAGVPEWFRLDGVARDIISIAVPAVLALAADPITALVDTGFVGHIGSAELAAVGAGNLLNAILDALLIFPLGLGVSGAALATVTSEYLTALILLWELNNKVVLFSWNIVGDGIIRYLKSGGLLIGRTIAVFLTLTLSTSLAAREGPVPMAGYEICLQVWLTISLLNDALALAAQALLASEYATGNYKQARMVLYRVLQVGGLTGVALAVTLFFGFGALSVLFTDDPAVLGVTKSGVWFVTISQPINAVAFVADGLYYGVSDFAYAAYSTFFAGAISSIFLLLAAPKFGLGGIWAGLTLFMSLRAIAGFWRVWSKGGPWELIWSETE